MLILILNGYFLASWLVKLLPALLESCKHAFTRFQNKYRAQPTTPAALDHISDLSDSFSLSHSRSSVIRPPNVSLRSQEPSSLVADC